MKQITLNFGYGDLIVDLLRPYMELERVNDWILLVNSKIAVADHGASGLNVGQQRAVDLHSDFANKINYCFVIVRGLPPRPCSGD